MILSVIDKHFDSLRVWKVTKEVDLSGWVFYTLKNCRNVEKCFGIKHTNDDYEVTFSQSGLATHDGGTLYEVNDYSRFRSENDVLNYVRKLENKWTW